MRRSACLLAVLGLLVQSTYGQDPFQKSNTRRSFQFFSAQKDEEAAPAEKDPQRFTRAEEAPQPEPTAEQRQNYYDQLFSGEGQKTAQTPIKQASATSDKSAPQESVIQADFVDSGKSNIQQIHAESFTARPFPGVAGMAREEKSSLTNPISVDDQPAARGSLTISRAPATQPTRPQAASAPAAQVAEAGPQTPAVTIEWVKRSDINVGQECRCDLLVKNSGKSTATDIDVEAYFPTNVRLVAAEPTPDRSDSYLGWHVNELKPGESRTIEVTMVPLERGALATRANVRFTGSATGSFVVAEPLLAVKLEGPQEVLIGEPATHTVVVSNPGTGVATNVEVEALIPAGLEHARGERLVMEIGSLNPGESRSVRLALAAVKGGRQVVQVQARGDSNLVRTASAEMSVIAPSLVASVDGPGLRYLGRQGTFTLSVNNDGAAATDNVRVMHKIPEGFDFVSSSRGANYDPATRLLNWFVGRLEPNQSAQMEVTLTAKAMGAHKHLVRATSEHGGVSDSELVTTVEGASSLAVDIVDLDDPVEVGTEAVYEVRVKNEGSAAAKNVGLSCELDSGMNFVSAKGPSDHIAEKGIVIFRTIPEVGPGQTLTYRVHVSSSKAANARFRARISSESVAEPLTTEELTKFYGE